MLIDARIDFDGSFTDFQEYIDYDVTVPATPNYPFNAGTKTRYVVQLPENIYIDGSHQFNIDGLSRSSIFPNTFPVPDLQYFVSPISPTNLSPYKPYLIEFNAAQAGQTFTITNWYGVGSQLSKEIINTQLNYNINAEEQLYNITNSNYTILDNDGYTIIEVTKTTGSGPNIITLPSAFLNIGRKITIKLIQNSTIWLDYLSINAVGGNTINEESSFLLNGAGNYVTVYSDGGTNWRVTNFYASYETPFIYCTDWTNRHLGSDTTQNADSLIEHNLGCSFSKIKTRVLFSLTTNDNEAWELLDAAINSDQTGITFYGVDNDSMKVQTGNARIIYITDAGLTGTMTTLAAYYKIIVERTRL